MKNRRNTAIALLAILGALGWRSSAQAQSERPETVLLTLRAKPGAEAALQEVLARHWSIAYQLNLVRETPHVTLRATEAGDRTRFVEIFTWRDAAIPDKAPTEIRALWDKMNGLVETRDGRPGLEFQPVSVIAP